jgi:ATP-dependent helicase YprA (DUF1998 family)
VTSVDCDYYTDAITYTKVTILDTFASMIDDRRPMVDDRWSMIDERSPTGDSRSMTDVTRSAHRPSPIEHRPSDRARRTASRKSHGEVHVVSRVVGFKKIKFYTNENVGAGDLDLPEQQMHTSSYWLTIPAEVMGALRYSADDRRDGVVGLAFAMRHVAQLLLMCDGHDIGVSIDGGSLEPPLRGRGAAAREARPAALQVEPIVFIYDNYPGGIGFSRPLFDMHATLLERTHELITSCPCDSGCPSCVGPEGNTGPHAKLVASEILGRLLAAEAV